MIKKLPLKICELRMQDYAVVISFFVGVFLFLYLTGALTSGYHFIDDHGMISIRTNLIDSSYLETVATYTKNDFLIRFRPIYYSYYVSIIEIFGTDFLKISIFVGVLASFSLTIFYIGMRKLKYPLFYSLLFILLVFMGSQMAIWWRLGTNETIGIFFLGLSFLFMSQCLERHKYKLKNALFVSFLIITSLCKESFIIIIPAFVLFKIWNEKKAFNITTKESFKNNKLLVLPIVIMFVELLIIKFVVGTNNTGYAGTTSSWVEFVIGVKNIIINPNSLRYWVGLMGVLLMLYIASFFFTTGKKWRKFNKSLNSLLLYVVFSIMIIVPQILMHAKSGMTERYLLPTTFGLAFLAIGIMQNTKQKIFKVFMMFAICIFIVISFNTAKTDAILFTESGKDANSLLSVVKDKSNVESKILLVADPVDRFEVSYSIKTYLSFYGFNNLYAQPVMKEYNSDSEIGLKKQWDIWFDGKKLKDIKASPDLIIIFDKVQTENFFSQSGVIKSEYENVFPDSESHAVYLKK